MLKGKAMSTKKSSKPASDGVLCNYPHRNCMQNRLEGYDYCMKHILEDKTAPYRQCNYIYPKNGKRCPNAASKIERRDGYCPDHMCRGNLYRQRAVRRRKPLETPESLVEDLEHYNVLEEFFDMEVDITKDISPQTLANLPLNAPVNRISKIIDYTSDSDSDAEPLAVDQTWKGDADSDAESIDSEQDDPLKHAGVYTAEEVAVITKEKLIRLQSLYLQQFKRLQHVIQEKRRKYLHALKQEKETGTAPALSSMTPKEVDKYKKLKAMLRYHRLNGEELLLHLQSKERKRTAADNVSYKAPSFTKCAYPERDKKCGLRAMPYTKYCSKHILSDKPQLLFRSCNFKDTNCTNPVVPVALMDACFLHCVVPPMPPCVVKENTPVQEQASGSQNIADPLDSLGQNSEDMCGMPPADFGPMSTSDMPCSLYEDSGSGDITNLSSAPKELWSGCLPAPQSKLREVLESIDLTPGELPPEQLLATN